MTDNSTPDVQQSMPVPPALITAGVGVGLLAAAAAVAYTRFQGEEAPPTAGSWLSVLDSFSGLSVPSVPPRRRVMINLAIRTIENDNSRKLVLSVLRALAKRA